VALWRPLGVRVAVVVGLLGADGGGGVVGELAGAREGV
jgi:hypothetical protein